MAHNTEEVLARFGALRDEVADLHRAVQDALSACEPAQPPSSPGQPPSANLLERLTELLLVLAPAATRPAAPPAPPPPRAGRADRNAVVEAVREASKVQGCPGLAVTAYIFAGLLAWNTLAHAVVALVERDRHPEHKYVALGTGAGSALRFWCGRRLCRRRRRQVLQTARLALRRISRIHDAGGPVGAPAATPAPPPVVPARADPGSPLPTTDPVAQPSPAPAGLESRADADDLLATRDWLVEAICAVAPVQGFPLLALPLLVPTLLLGAAALVTAVVALGSGVAAVGWVSFGLGMGSFGLSPLAWLACRWRRWRLVRALDEVARRHDTVLKRHPEALRVLPTPFHRADPLASAWGLVRFLEERSGHRRTVRFCCPGNDGWFVSAQFYDLYIDGEYRCRSSARAGFDERLPTTPGKHQLLVRHAFGVGPTPQHALGRTPVTLDFTIGVDAVREVEFRHERSPGTFIIVRMS
jgi:hypothetical protein